LYEFGPFRIDSSQRALLRSGTPVRLPPKTFEVLLALVESGGRILTKEELLGRVWPDTVVEEANLSHHVFALRKVLSDDGQDGKFIETIPKRGYRFAAEVHEPPADRTPSATEDRFSNEPGRDTVSKPGRTQPPPIVVGAVTAVLIAMGVAGYLAFGERLSPVDPGGIKSLAVLPFDPLAGDLEEPLALGLADTLITRLSAVRKISIRPVSAVRRYAGPRRDSIQAGRDLSVDAILDGSIQRAGDRVRVTVRLFRVADGVSLWAGTFDENVADILAVQDAISVRVAGALSLPVNREERRRLAKRETDARRLISFTCWGATSLNCGLPTASGGVSSTYARR
jgi:DNA-binding winged helix-turn-helix (wHTH) protein/TolB-like protein